MITDLNDLPLDEHMRIVAHGLRVLAERFEEAAAEPRPTPDGDIGPAG